MNSARAKVTTDYYSEQFGGSNDIIVIKSLYPHESIGLDT